MPSRLDDERRANEWANAHENRPIDIRSLPVQQVPAPERTNDMDIIDYCQSIQAKTDALYTLLYNKRHAALTSYRAAQAVMDEALEELRCAEGRSDI